LEEIRSITHLFILEKIGKEREVERKRKKEYFKRKGDLAWGKAQEED